MPTFFGPALYLYIPSANFPVLYHKIWFCKEKNLITSRITSTYSPSPDDIRRHAMPLDAICDHKKIAEFPGFFLFLAAAPDLYL